MKGVTHGLLGPLGLAGLAALTANTAAWPHEPLGIAYLAATAAVAALLPDIDSDEAVIRQVTGTARSRSLLGRAFSFALRLATGHRGALTHSLLAWVVVSFIAGMHFYGNMFFVAFSVGYLSHLLADALTPQGVPLFWPLYRGRIRFLPRRLAIPTGSAAEYIFTVVVGMIVAGLYRPHY